MRVAGAGMSGASLVQGHLVLRGVTAAHQGRYTCEGPPGAHIHTVDLKVDKWKPSIPAFVFEITFITLLYNFPLPPRSTSP